MKISILKVSFILSLFHSSHTFLWATDLTLPENDPIIQDDLNPPPEPEFTTAELAAPPGGQIQKSHLRTVNRQRTILAATLAAVPAGTEGQGSL